MFLERHLWTGISWSSQPVFHFHDSLGTLKNPRGLSPSSLGFSSTNALDFTVVVGMFQLMKVAISQTHQDRPNGTARLFRAGTRGTPIRCRGVSGRGISGFQNHRICLDLKNSKMFFLGISIYVNMIYIPGSSCGSFFLLFTQNPGF